jgi:hypothetical protein
MASSCVYICCQLAHTKSCNAATQAISRHYVRNYYRRSDDTYE